MKEFLKSINWDKFIKYELVAIATVAFLCLVSKNELIEKLIFGGLLLILWSLLVFFSAFSTYYLNKNVTNRKNLTYKKEKNDYERDTYHKNIG